MLRFASAPMTALKRSSKSPRKRVPASSARRCRARRPRRPSAAPGTSSSSSRARAPRPCAVLPTPASPTNTGLFLRRRQRISIVRCSSSVRPISGSSSPAAARSRQVHRVRRQRIAAPCCVPRPRPRARRVRGARPGPRRAADGHLGDAVRDVVEDVEPRDALRGEQLRRIRLRLLQHRREHVAGAHLLTAGALDVQHGGLQHAAERQRLLGLRLRPAAELLDRLREVRVEVACAAAAGPRRTAARIRSPSGSCASA